MQMTFDMDACRRLDFGGLGNLSKMLVVFDDLHGVPLTAGEDQHVPEWYGGTVFSALPRRLGRQLPTVVIEVQPPAEAAKGVKLLQFPFTAHTTIQLHPHGSRQGGSAFVQGLFHTLPQSGGSAVAEHLDPSRTID
jgi:hypothetical protein